jgi:hypothetical protein
VAAVSSSKKPKAKSKDKGLDDDQY